MNDRLKTLQSQMPGKWYQCPRCGQSMLLMADSGVKENEWPKEGEIFCPTCEPHRKEWEGKQLDYQKRAPEIFRGNRSVH